MRTYQDDASQPAGEPPERASEPVERSSEPVEPVERPNEPVERSNIADDLAAQAATASAGRLRSAEVTGGGVHAGLLRWLVVLVVLAFASIVTSHPDVSLFLAIAGMFALAGSWDTRDRARTGDPVADAALEPGGLGTVLRVVVPLVVPFAGALLYAGIGVYARSQPATVERVAAGQWCAAAAAVCLLAAFPPITQLFANVFMRREPHGFVARLTASIAIIVLLLPVPVQLLKDDLMDFLLASGKPLVEPGALVGQLVGEVLFAAAAVRLWVGRDVRAVAERLGLARMGWRHIGVAALGLVAVIALNSGMEWLEQRYFPLLWVADQEMGRLIAGEIGVGTALVLGVSAGVGEELLVRGALQPRVGLVWASLLFAAGHVQYTWFGMATIALLGITLGLVRNRANTTTAIVVHVLYDIIAVLMTR